MRSSGGEPDVMWRSEASSAAARSRSVSMEKGCGVMRTDLSAGGVGRFREVAGNHSIEVDQGPARGHPPSRVSSDEANHSVGGKESQSVPPIEGGSGYPS